MYSLRQSRRARGHSGEALPTVFKSLTNAGAVFRRGQLVLVSAGPGTGKSAFVLTETLKAKVPALYFSADSDAFEQLARSISIITGTDFDQARKSVLRDSLDDYEAALAGLPVRFNFEASPSLDSVESTVRAYVQLYGGYPSLIVVDNITNVRTETSSGDDDPFSGLEALMDYLHDMARQTGACVIGLHHVTGRYNDADQPIPMSGVKGQIARVPEMVLTMFSPGEGRLGVSVVKNRGGKKDPSGKTYVELEFDGDRMHIDDIGSWN